MSPKSTPLNEARTKRLLYHADGTVVLLWQIPDRPLPWSIPLSVEEAASLREALNPPRTVNATLQELEETGLVEVREATSPSGPSGPSPYATPEFQALADAMCKAITGQSPEPSDMRRIAALWESRNRPDNTSLLVELDTILRAARVCKAFPFQFLRGEVPRRRNDGTTEPGTAKLDKVWAVCQPNFWPIRLEAATDHDLGDCPHCATARAYDLTPQRPVLTDLDRATITWALAVGAGYPLPKNTGESMVHADAADALFARLDAPQHAELAGRRGAPYPKRVHDLRNHVGACVMMMDVLVTHARTIVDGLKESGSEPDAMIVSDIEAAVSVIEGVRDDVNPMMRPAEFADTECEDCGGTGVIENAICACTNPKFLRGHNRHLHRELHEIRTALRKLASFMGDK